MLGPIETLAVVCAVYALAYLAHRAERALSALETPTSSADAHARDC